ncbi:hypothetical protein [Kineosporia succinea]|uniref:alpha-amylase n=1 Tax=Kineosporia succinea TaxID=84632 RepID=A0ABT9PB10_9ACTN|nr:hypothetical protein [Kineosporia succinea]MDP9829881.1 hypothetical protein [Kineosporia succinea]
MEVSLITQDVVLEPGVPGDVLVDIVNTADVIDAVHVELDGVPGTTVSVEGTPTLFPGERRRVTLRVQLPTHTPAGRHLTIVRVNADATEELAESPLTIDVRPRPVLTVGAKVKVQRGVRHGDFPLTVANRGNTPITVRVRETDAPDGVSVVFRPETAIVEPWHVHTCRVRVTGPRHLVGGVREHSVDLRVDAEAFTPSLPLLREELTGDARVTFRQRPVISTGLLLALGLVVVLTAWGLVGRIGVKRFAPAEAAPLAAPVGFARNVLPARSDVGVTLSGKVRSGADESAVAGVRLLLCSLETDDQARTCTARRAAYRGVSDADGDFSLAETVPGTYSVAFESEGRGLLQQGRFALDDSCSLQPEVPPAPGALRLRVIQEGSPAAVAVSAQIAVRPVETPEPSAESTGATEPAPACQRVGSPPPPYEPHPGLTAPPRSTTSGYPAGMPEDEANRNQYTAATSSTGTQVTAVIENLPAPGRYDVTVDAGGRSVVLHSVPVEPGTKDPGALTVRVPAADEPAAAEPPVP